MKKEIPLFKVYMSPEAVTAASDVLNRTRTNCRKI